MASFPLPESPISPFGSPRNGGSRDWEEFASVLLEDGFILTALELHTELLEYGKEIPTLRDYFSNPGNFEHALPQPPSSGLLRSDMSTCSLAVASHCTTCTGLANLISSPLINSLRELRLLAASLFYLLELHDARLASLITAHALSQHTLR